MNNATLYSKCNELQRHDAAHVLDDYFKNVRWGRRIGGDFVLDVGCGSGDVTADLLLPRLPQDSLGLVVGSDLSEEMVKYAVATHLHPKLRFLRLDIASEEMPPHLHGHFDHVFSFYCLHWVQEQRRAFHNIHTLLRPGGDILLTFLASNPIFTIYKKLSGDRKWQPYMQDVDRFVSPYQHVPNPETIIDGILNETGFVDRQCVCEERTYVFGDLGTLRRSIYAVNPFMERIPDQMKDEYFNDYLNQVRNMNFLEENNNKNSNTRVNILYKLIIVTARKR